MNEYEKNLKEAIVNPGEGFIAIDLVPIIQKYTKKDKLYNPASNNIEDIQTFDPRASLYKLATEITDIVSGLTRSDDMLYAYQYDIHYEAILQEITLTLSQSHERCAILYSTNVKYRDIMRSLYNNMVIMGLIRPTGKEFKNRDYCGKITYGMPSFDQFSSVGFDMCWVGDEALSYILLSSDRQGIADVMAPFMINRLGPAYKEYLSHMDTKLQHLTAVNDACIFNENVEYFSRLIVSPENMHCSIVEAAELNALLSRQDLKDVLMELDQVFPLKLAMNVTEYPAVLKRMTGFSVDIAKGRVCSIPKDSIKTPVDKLRYILDAAYTGGGFKLDLAEILAANPLYNIKDIFERITVYVQNLEWPNTRRLFLSGSFHDVMEYQDLIRNATLINAADAIDELFREV